MSQIDEHMLSEVSYTLPYHPTLPTPVFAQVLGVTGPRIEKPWHAQECVMRAAKVLA